MSTARLIYNPTSGREEMKRLLPSILQRLDEGGVETTVHATTGEGDATVAAAEAVDRGYDIVIAAGGDGTLYEVINGLASKERRPKLGILPLGTTNDFARGLGIPKSWDYACDLIIAGHAEDIDVGKMNDRYFINIAGGGSLTQLTYEVPSKLKTVLGQMAYYMKGLEMLPFLRPIEISFRSEELILNEEVMLFLIANSRSVGGFEKLAPAADLQDGMFDVVILRKCNLAEFVKIASMALRGEHLDDPHVVHFQTKRIEISSPEHVQINLDGELGGSLPSTFEVLAGHIQVIVDETGHATYNQGNGLGLFR